MSRLVNSRLSQQMTVQAFLDDDFVWEAAERLEALAAEAADGSRGGRPRSYPLVCALIWDALLGVFGSARQVEVELGCGVSGWWELIRRSALKRAGVVLPDRPMRRHHYRYLRDRYLTASNDQLAELSEVFSAHAAELAVGMGLCDPEGEGSLTHPSTDRVVAGDGKVVTPRYRTSPAQRGIPDPTTGEIRYKRADPDAGLHVVGGGETAFGTKYVLFSTRGNERNRRIVLDVAHCPSAGTGAEAGVAIETLDRVLPRLPGTQAVVYDGAMRGTHLHQILTRHGVIPIVRVYKAKGGGVPDRFLEKARVAGNIRGLERVDIHTVNGAPHFRQIAVDGSTQLHPLIRSKTLRRSDRDAWRFYGEYQLPDLVGGGTIRIRLDRTNQDVKAGFNREENLRAIAPADPDHDRLMARRNDTESGNRLLDDSMLRERAHTVGWRRQLLNITTWAAMRNASAALQHAPPASSDPPALAA